MVDKVPFIMAELGADVDPFVLHMYAALAQKERALITIRAGVCRLSCLQAAATHSDFAKACERRTAPKRTTTNQSRSPARQARAAAAQTI